MILFLEVSFLFLLLLLLLFLRSSEGMEED